MTAPMQQKHAANPYLGIQRQPCQNNSSTNTIPPFGLVRVMGTTTDGALLVDQPNQDGQDVYVNGPQAILPNNGATPALGGFGMVTKAFPIWAQYDTTSGTPAIGDTWGAANGSYLLTKGKGGFVVQANPVSTTGLQGPPRVLVAPSLQDAGDIAFINSGPNSSGYYDATIKRWNGSSWISIENVWLKDAN